MDTNVITYFVVRGARSSQAEKVYVKDSVWAAPFLWRSEFRNVLWRYVRQGLLTLDEAIEHQKDGEMLLEGREFQVASPQVLRLADESGCSPYDCEFVVLARKCGVPLVTADNQLLATFQPTAVSMEEFAR